MAPYVLSAKEDNDARLFNFLRYVWMDNFHKAFKILYLRTLKLDTNEHMSTLKFHGKYFTHTLQDYFLNYLKFKLLIHSQACSSGVDK